MEPKINVVAKDGKVVIGGDFHVLKDQSQITFKTDKLEAFKGYLAASPEDDKFEIFYDHRKCYAMSSNTTRYSKPLATCAIQLSVQAGRVENLIGKAFAISQFEDLLGEMKKYLDFEGQQLLAKVRDFKMQKITDVERQKDDNGNYKYAVQRKNNKETAEFPEVIFVTVPLLQFHPETVKIPMEPVFDYSDGGDGDITLSFKLRCLEFDEIIQDAQLKIMEEYLSGIEVLKHWGSLEVTNGDDSWKYKENPLRYTGR